MKQDLAAYIGHGLRDLNPFFQWKVQNNSNRQTVEVLVSFRIDLEDKAPGIQDQFGTTLNTNYLQFEDVIAFYDPIQSDIQPGNYLRAIPFDNTLGIDRGQVDVTLKHLNRVLSAGKTDLQDFVQDSQRHDFHLNWDQHNLDQALETAKSLDRFGQDKLFMDFEKHESLIKTFTEGKQNDGVERI